jgi:quinoprotein relay system zinc metallohydrolase 2
MVALWLICCIFSVHRSHAGPVPEPLPVVEIAAGIFVYQGAYETFTPDNAGLVSNMAFIVGAKAVAVVDTGGSRLAGERLKASIRARTALPISYVINTHMHPDHIFGNVAFSTAGTRFVGHGKLARALQARGGHYLDANRPLLGEELIGEVEIIAPEIEVEDRLELDLGDRTIVLTAHATAHTDNDLTVFDRKTGTLIAGDLLFSRHTPAVDGSIVGWLTVMARLDDRGATPVKRVVPGHGPASLPWPDGMDEQRRYLELITGEVRAYIADGRSMSKAMEEVGRSEAANWLLFDEFNARNVAAAFAELEWE